MKTLYLNDQTRDFPNFVKEIIFLGPIYPHGLTYTDTEGVHIGYMKEKLNTVDETMVTGKVEATSYPAFNGDIINKVKTNNFYLKTMTTLGKGTLTEIEKKGRVIKHVPKVVIGNDNITNIPYSVITYDKFKKLPDGGYDIRSFIPNLKVEEYLLTNEPISFTLPYALNKAASGGDYLVNEDNIEVLHSPYFNGEMPDSKDNLDGWKEDTFNIVNTYDTSARPWTFQRNFNNSPNTFSDKTPSLDRFSLLTNISNSVSNSMAIAKGFLFFFYSSNVNSEIVCTRFKIVNGEIDFNNPVELDMSVLYSNEGVPRSAFSALVVNGDLVMGVYYGRANDIETFYVTERVYFAVSDEGELSVINRIRWGLDVIGYPSCREYIMRTSSTWPAFQIQPSGLDKYNTKTTYQETASLRGLADNLDDNTNIHYLIPLGKYCYAYQKNEVDGNRMSMGKSRIGKNFPYGGWSLINFPITSKLEVITYFVTTRRNMFAIQLINEGKTHSLWIHEFLVSLTDGEITYTGVSSYHELGKGFTGIHRAPNVFITSNRIYIISSISNSGLNVLQFPFSGGKDDYFEESHLDFRKY